ncbi:hypothetical protein HK102_005551 [Quaeritorhiza haematococci]|nr:hypothetical protein HK102_005551 [Quaeritorhiza haematococci]
MMAHDKSTSSGKLLGLLILIALLAITFPQEVPAIPIDHSELEAETSEFNVKSNPIPNQYLVLFNSRAGVEGEAAEKALLKRVLQEARHHSGNLTRSEIRILQRIPMGDDMRLWVVMGPRNLADRINRNGTVAVVEPNQTVELYGGSKKKMKKLKDKFSAKTRVPSRPAGDWGLKKISQSNKYLYPSNGGRDVDVYVVDGGIDIDHPEFEGRVSNGVSFVAGGSFEDLRGHGTHVAGIIASKTWGVAPKANVISVRVFGSDGRTNTSTIIQGLSYIVQRHRARKRKIVVNMSFGMLAIDPLIYQSFIRAAVQRGIYFVAAAGNEDMDACITVPANVPEVITVGAINYKNEIYEDSNFGTCVDILAPGVDVESTYPRIRGGGGRRRLTGTSMATPFVAGTLALILGERDFSSVEEGRQYLMKIATRGAIKMNDFKPRTKDLLLYNGRPRGCWENPCTGLVE